MGKFEVKLKSIDQNYNQIFFIHQMQNSIELDKSKVRESSLKQAACDLPEANKRSF